MNSNHESTFLRKSHIFLISRLIALEIILSIVYLLVRIPKSFIFSSGLSLSDNQFLSIVGVLYFITLSIIELILVLKVTLDWVNEEFEIREESLVHRRGIFHLTQETYTLRQLGSANIYQGFVGRILNYGTIVIASPILKKDVFLTDIHNPQQVIKLLEDNIERSNVAGSGGVSKKY